MTDEKSCFFIRETIPSIPFFLGEPGIEDFWGSNVDVFDWVELFSTDFGADTFGTSDFKIGFGFGPDAVSAGGDEIFGIGEFNISVLPQFTTIIAG